MTDWLNTQSTRATVATWLAVLAVAGAGIWLGLRIGLWLAWPGP